MTALEATATEVATEFEARQLTDEIRHHVQRAWGTVVTAYQKRVWLALGYESWDAYCDGEFDGARISLPREERTEAVRSLRDAGMSTRAIASAVGVSDGTVRNDLAGAQDYAPPPVVGTDGKSYAATRPRPEPTPEPEPEPIDDDEWEPGGWLPENHQPTPTPAPPAPALTAEQQREQDLAEAAERNARMLGRIHDRWPYFTGLRRDPDWRERVLAACDDMTRQWVTDVEALIYGD